MKNLQEYISTNQPKDVVINVKWECDRYIMSIFLIDASKTSDQFLGLIKNLSKITGISCVATKSLDGGTCREFDVAFFWNPLELAEAIAQDIGSMNLSCQVWTRSDSNSEPEPIKTLE